MEITSTNYKGQYSPSVDEILYRQSVNKPIEPPSFFWLIFSIVIIIVIILILFFIWWLVSKNGQDLNETCNGNNICKSTLYCSGDLTCQTITDSVPVFLNDICRESIQCQYPLQCLEQKCQ